MIDNDTITIYWAAALFTDEDPAWDMLYRNPQQLFNKARLSNTHGGALPKCPATKALLRHVYSFESAIEDTIPLDPQIMKQFAYTEDKQVVMPNATKLQLTKNRPSSVDGHINLEYSMGWALFADAPITARMTAPYYPTSSPVEGALLAPGEFDIGQWYRPLILDYHIPVDATEFKIKEGQPLFYLELLTDKKIKFQRYVMTKRLTHILSECVESPKRYSANQSLEKRYEMGEKSSLRERVLAEIKKSLE